MSTKFDYDAQIGLYRVYKVEVMNTHETTKVVLYPLYNVLHGDNKLIALLNCVKPIPSK